MGRGRPADQLSTPNLHSRSKASLPGFARHPASPRPHRTQPKGNFEFGGRPDVLKAFGDSVRGYTVYLLQIQYDKSPPSIGRAVAGVALRHVINQIDL